MLVEVLQSLEVLSRNFESHLGNWINLKNDPEFWRDVDHNSPIRTMYAEGKGYAEYLKNSLKTEYVNKSMLVDVYIDGVRKTMPEKLEYDTIGRAAQKDIELNYQGNYTVSYMMDLYWE
ncbi:hypothetical protein, partial [Pseudomonas protegens]